MRASIELLMLNRFISPLALLTLGLTTGCVVRNGRQNPEFQAEAKAVAFLQREVPAWSKENSCYSCHNNGDAARALIAAKQVGHRVPKGALADTLAWVSKPDQWDHNKGDPGFSDLRLANLQFAASLRAATEVKQVMAPNALKAAARRVAKDQAADGSWPIEPHNPAGSPVTYGTALATFTAIQILHAADERTFHAPITNAVRWLAASQVNSVVAAATLLRAAPSSRSPALSMRHSASLEFLRRAQNSDGGWGAYPDSPSEPFDTAVVLLALIEPRSEPDVAGLIVRGRTFLIREQRADGSWPATTRPPGGESYAQQISTTGWATLALLATRP